MERISGWEKWDKKTQKEAVDFCEPYKQFLSENKTERLFVKKCVKIVEKLGYKPLESYKKLSQGSKFYKINKEKLLMVGTIGKTPLTDGCRLIVAHIDSPRLDLKTSPIYQDEEFCMFKTYYYGGIKKYQWLTIPLAIYGTVVFKNGEKKEFVIGEREDDPVFTITDILPHLGKEQMSKVLSEAFPGEKLNVVIGSIPDKKSKKNKVKNNILNILKSKVGMLEEDFFSSELQLVPAGKLRDVGFDKSMVLGYGQDDRVCSYTAFKAHIDIPTPQKTSICMLVDQEEIGSPGATSAASLFFEFTIEDIIERSGLKPSNFKNVIQNSQAISADVGILLDPNFKEAFEPRNAARIGCGIILEKNTGRAKGGCIEPSPEYLAFLRDLFEKNNVLWQSGEMGKLELGGGGTVATFFAKYNIDTIDCGTGVLSMHAPYELTSKADIYSTYLAYKAFYK
ncbi:aminopeptidase [bacterium]|nr:aminopeptidase [bacterium]